MPATRFVPSNKLDGAGYYTQQRYGAEMARRQNCSLGTMTTLLATPTLGPIRLNPRVPSFIHASTRNRDSPSILLPARRSARVRMIDGIVRAVLRST